LVLVFWPHVAAAQAERRQRRRGWWLASTWEGMVALDGLVDPEAGQSLVAALEPLARPAGATDERSGSQRRADALVELARRSLEAGRLPQSGGVRPQLLVTVDLLGGRWARPGPGPGVRPPEVAVEVSFLGWESGRLRHPAYAGLTRLL
jgi:hypothetical protein